MKKTFARRADIDGLRGLAILMVIDFHYSLTNLLGGYIGVDMFFVISGYLITFLIEKRIQSGEFSFGDFYRRRAWRIIPATLPVFVFVLTAGYFLVSADHLKYLAVSVVYQVFFSINVYQAFSGMSYMTMDMIMSRPTALVHFWSLAVEEQFYFLHPLLIYFSVERGGGKRIVLKRLWIIFAVSLGLSTFCSYVILLEQYSYYLLPMRAWELVIGALIALCPIGVLPRWSRETISTVGVILIGFAWYAFDRTTAFPGVAALLPTVGTALVIMSNGEKTTQTFVGKMLSFPPLVFVGLISYSLYLWHWPVQVFFEYYAVDNKSNPLLCILIVLPISILSYFLIEKSFSKPRVSAKMTLLLSAGALSFLLCVALIIIGNHGFPKSFEKGDLLSELGIPMENLRWKSQTEIKCILDHDEMHQIGDISDGAPDFLIWGDSHAGAAGEAMKYLADEYGIDGYVAVFFSEPPLFGYWPDNRPIQEGTTLTEMFETREMIFSYAVRSGIKNVILVSEWGGIVRGIDPDDSERLNLALGRFRQNLKETVQRFQNKGINVYITLPTPFQDFDVPSKLIARRGRIKGGISGEEHMKRCSVINDLIRDSGARILDPSPLFFRDDGLSIIKTDGGLPIYVDTNHLNKCGAELLKEAYRPCAEEIARRRRSP